MMDHVNRCGSYIPFFHWGWDKEATPVTPVAAPVITSPISGTETSNREPILHGTSAPNAVITIYMDGSPIGATTSDASGAWTFPVLTGTITSDGTYVFTAKATLNGVQSPLSNSVILIIDELATNYILEQDGAILGDGAGNRLIWTN